MSESENLGEIVATRLRLALEAYEHFESTLAQLNADEKALWGRNFYLTGTGDFWREKGKLKDEAFELLLRLASLRLMQGLDVDINTHALLEHAAPRSEHGYFDKGAVDLAKAWAWLEANYGGARGQEIAHQQMADALVRALSIDAGEEPCYRSGRLILNYRVYSEKGWSGDMALSYSCSNGVCGVLDKLTAFLAWAEDEESIPRVRALIRKIGQREPIVSREKHACGAFTVTTYFSRFEFAFEPHTGERLLEYLSMYSQRLAEAA